MEPTKRQVAYVVDKGWRASPSGVASFTSQIEAVLAGLEPSGILMELPPDDTHDGDSVPDSRKGDGGDARVSSVRLALGYLATLARDIGRVRKARSRMAGMTLVCNEFGCETLPIALRLAFPFSRIIAISHTHPGQDAAANHLVRRWAEKCCHACVSDIVFNSHALKAEWVMKLGRGKIKGGVIPYGIPEPDTRIPDDYPPKSDGTVDFVCVARFVRWKGHRELLQAWRKVSGVKCHGKEGNDPTANIECRISNIECRREEGERLSVVGDRCGGRGGESEQKEAKKENGEDSSQKIAKGAEGERADGVQQKETKEGRAKTNGLSASSIQYPVSSIPPSPSLRRAGQYPSFAKPTAGRPVSLLRQAYGGQASIRLVLVGDGPELPGMKALARNLGIEDTVIFLGEKTQGARYFNGADVGVLLSIEPEAFGLVLLETMSRGKPVIASRMGGIPEVVVHEQTGFLVNPLDAADVASALRWLASSAEERERLGRAGRRRWESRFTLQHMQAEYRRLFGSWE